MAPDDVMTHISSDVFITLTQLNFLRYEDIMSMSVCQVKCLKKLKEQVSKNDPTGGLDGALTNLMGGLR